MRYDPDISIIECPYVYPPKEDTFLLLKNIDVGPGEPVLEMGCGTGLITVSSCEGRGERDLGRHQSLGDRVHKVQPDQERIEIQLAGLGPLFHGGGKVRPDHLQPSISIRRRGRGSGKGMVGGNRWGQGPREVPCSGKGARFDRVGGSSSSCRPRCPRPPSAAYCPHSGERRSPASDIFLKSFGSND